MLWVLLVVEPGTCASVRVQHSRLMVSVAALNFFVLLLVLVIIVLLPAPPVFVYRFQSLRFFRLFWHLNWGKRLFLGLPLLAFSLDNRLFLLFRVFLILAFPTFVLIVHPGVIKFLIGSLANCILANVLFYRWNIYNFKP